MIFELMYVNKSEREGGCFKSNDPEWMVPYWVSHRPGLLIYND